MYYSILFDTDRLYTFKKCDTLNQLVRQRLYMAMKEEGFPLSKQGIYGYMLSWVDWYNEVNDGDQETIVDPMQVVDSSVDALLYSNVHFLYNRNSVSSEQLRGAYDYLVKFIELNLTKFVEERNSEKAVL